MQRYDCHESCPKCGTEVTSHIMGCAACRESTKDSNRLGSNYANFELSSATMIPLDLVDNFLSFLNSVADNCSIADRILSIEEDLPVDEDATAELDWILYEEIWPLLESIAPEGCWFGSHPGDGACFGFWSLDLLEG